MTTAGKGSLGLPEGRTQAFSITAWLIEPFTKRNLNLDN